MELKTSFRAARKNQGKAPWCVDTRTLLGKSGSQNFFQTKADAAHFIKHYSSELVISDSASHKWVMQILCDRYLALVDLEFQRGERSRSSLIGTTRFINQVLECSLEGKPLGSWMVIDIDKGHIQLDLMDQLRFGGVKDGRSQKTMLNIMGAVNGLFEFAKTMRCRTHNPYDGVKVKGHPGKDFEKKLLDPETITPENIAAIIGAMDPRWKVITSFAANTGLRQGELRVLTWGDIFFDKNIISVNKAMKHLESRVGAPKSVAGKRDVPFTKNLKKQMQEFYIANGRPGDDDLVFPFVPGEGTRHAHFSRAKGTVMNKKDFLSAVHSACDVAGIQRITWHALRHFTASLLLAKMDNSKWEVSGRLGHAQRSTTEDIYGHIIPSKKVEVEEDLIAL